MKQLLSFFLAMAMIAPGAAETIEAGRVSLPVEDRSTGQRTEALTEGLLRVLVRLTGMRDPAGSPEVAALLEADPSRWVLQYSYQERGPEATKEQSPDSGDTAEAAPELPLLISASYDVSGLSTRLADAGAPVWGTERPSVLLWIVDQGAARGEFIGRDDRGELVEVLRRTAADRGLPVLLPQLDGDDRRRIRPADVRGLFDEPVMEASRRYDSHLVATAVLYRGSEPHLRWRLFEQQQQVRDGDIAEGTPQELAAALVHRVTDYVADLYAVRGGTGHAVSLRIKQLSDLADWKKAHDHLAGLAGMQALHIERLEGTTVTFNGRFTGSLAQLDRLVRLQSAMRHCPPSAAPVEAGADGAGSARLEFCWGHDG